MQLVEPFLPRSGDAVTPKELAELITRKQVQPVDIRDEGAYGRYRIPTAINIPQEKIKDSAQELAPTDGRIRVLYGRTTDEAKESAKAMQKAGLQVAFLEGGFLHWEADGLEVERG